jgi:hypothetical protein
MFNPDTRLKLRRKELLAGGSSGPRPQFRLSGIICLAACAFAAVAFPAGSASASQIAASASGRAAVAAVSAPPASRSVMVTNLSSSGPGSLRAAITAADAGRPGSSAVIGFKVSGTIRLASQLPAISRPVKISAVSAPGHVRGGPPVVAINCNGHAGLRFRAASGGSQLLGVAVDNASGVGVTLESRSITLDNDYIGLNLTGAIAGNHGDGVYVSAASSRDLIGLNSSGASGVIANVISGNTGNGIVFSGSSDNTVVSNYIGTNVTGMSAMPNGGDGITIVRGSDGNQIGGTDFVDPATGQENNPTGSKGKVTPVFVVPPLGNLISGNFRDGVYIGSGSDGNVLNGNFVGTTASGNAAIGNAGNGVWINRANGNSLIGCKFVNNPFVYYNVLSGNGKNGLLITSASNTTVQGNFLGIGANNTVTVSNRLNGIRVDGSSANTQVGGVIPLGNVSAGNGQNGIDVAGRARGFVTFNTFGGLLAFKGAAPNGNDGLLVTSTGGDNVARTNVFSGNNRNGVELARNASGVTLDPNIAGMSTNGKSALPNGGDGVLIDGNAHANIIGGSRVSVIRQDTFSGNLGYGLAIEGRAHGNQVFGNFIGTTLAGVKPQGNRAGGVLIGGRAYRNSIGNSQSRPSDLISGNRGIGVTLLAGTRGNFVINNYIGLDRFGRRLPNTGRPIVNRGRGNHIRGNRH